MEVDAINVVDYANLPTEKSSPNNARNAETGAMIGALLVCAIVIIRHLLDDTIKTREDVEKYLQISCLAMIPLDEAVILSDPVQKRKRGNRRKKRMSGSSDLKIQRNRNR